MTVTIFLQFVGVSKFPFPCFTLFEEHDFNTAQSNFDNELKYSQATQALFGQLKKIIFIYYYLQLISLCFN